MSERRRFQRIPFVTEAELQQGQQQWLVELHDLSLRGVLVSRPADWSAQPEARCRVRIPLGVDAEVVMTVSLAHQEADWLGFHCDEIDLDSITHLRRLLELNIGSSSLLERDLAALLYG
ncbi:PilZ domain-containing protein [Pseudomonas sp. NW5]|uniref:PilZ domain-containing protein n=1 Tax=Pseudomonas sp. NW5 TaxID=2934934 RepID=UPI002021649A|nr:PilZ domain-containing protein [Pseudomonas sp. NW5]MCL7461927.1 PilZ domain-containing protein [Pseudomonas sp. NW5]